MTDEEKEQKAILCVRSLSNISKDLKELDQLILSDMCLFIANNLLQVYRKPEMPIGQVHGNAPHNTDIKNEILNVVKEVKAGFTQKKIIIDDIKEAARIRQAAVDKIAKEFSPEEEFSSQMRSKGNNDLNSVFPLNHEENNAC